MQVQQLKWFNVFNTFMYFTYFQSLYPFAVPKPDFLYKTASLQQRGDISFHAENKF